MTADDPRTDAVDLPEPTPGVAHSVRELRVKTDPGDTVRVLYLTSQSKYQNTSAVTGTIRVRSPDRVALATGMGEIQIIGPNVPNRSEGEVVHKQSDARHRIGVFQRAELEVDK